MSTNPTCDDCGGNIAHDDADDFDSCEDCRSAGRGNGTRGGESL